MDLRLLICIATNREVLNEYTYTSTCDAYMLYLDTCKVMSTYLSVGPSVLVIILISRIVKTCWYWYIG